MEWTGSQNHPFSGTEPRNDTLLLARLAAMLSNSGTEIYVRTNTTFQNFRRLKVGSSCKLHFGAELNFRRLLVEYEVLLHKASEKVSLRSTGFVKLS